MQGDAQLCSPERRLTCIQDGQRQEDEGEQTPGEGAGGNGHLPALWASSTQSLRSSSLGEACAGVTVGSAGTPILRTPHNSSSLTSSSACSPVEIFQPMMTSAPTHSLKLINKLGPETPKKKSEKRGVLPLLGGVKMNKS